VSKPHPRYVEEWQTFWLAIGFLTRIPVLVRVDYSERLMNNSSMYFPVVGLLLGVIYAAAYTSVNLVFTPLVSVLLVIVLHLWVTGAFHEDGLADSVDGLGGGYTTEDRLRIMKDSRIGTYGAIALFMALALKTALLLESRLVWLALLMAPCVSRVTPLLLMRWLPYVTTLETGKTRTVAVGFSTARFMAATAATGCVVITAHVMFGDLIVPSLIAVLSVALLWGGYLKRTLGGYTGDTLGACVVMAELVFLALLT
jgi:adenosylcobinamide-GDP ribazoletransferase